MTERKNWDRAEEGLRLCDLMHDMTGVDELPEQIADALCHLMHTCRLVRDEAGEVIDFEQMLAAARANFDKEVDEDDD